VIQWKIDGAALLTRRRIGGDVAQKGTEYQRTYALLKACEMLDSANGICAVRWEGAQDIDLKLANGTELYIQTKNEAPSTLTLNSLDRVLAAFAADLLDAPAGTVRFLIVARAARLDASIERLRTKASTAFDVHQLAVAIAKFDDRLRSLTNADRIALCTRLTQCVEIDAPCGHEIDGTWSFETFAERLLRRYGVRDSQREHVLNYIYRQFANRRVIEREELVAWMEPHRFAKRKTAAMHPALARFYVARPAIYNAASAGIFSDTTGTVALRAMGGGGKTLLATALSHDERINRRYPDGVLWATLGQTPNIVSSLTIMLAVLGLSPQSGNVEACSSHLRDALATRQCLIVADDVWALEHANAFLPGQGSSRLLITTRDRSICEQMNAVTVEVGTMTRAESLRLLATLTEGSGHGVADEEAFHVLAERVGDLPLALHLGGVQVREGRRVADILEAIDEAERKLDAFELQGDGSEFGRLEERRLRSLRACFELSVRLLPEGLRKTLFAMAILRGGEQINASEAELLLGPVSGGTVRRHLIQLSSKALVVDAHTAAEERWSIHDLIHDYVRDTLFSSKSDLVPPGMPRTSPEAHLCFLARCHTGKFWADAPNLRYIDRNLGWHAQNAGQSCIVHALISEEDGRPLWLLRLREAGCGELFLAEINRSIRLSHLDLLKREPGAIGENIGQVIRAALARGSIVSKANKLPPPLVARLIAEGRLTAAEGLAHIRLTNGLHRIWSLARVSPYLPIDQRGAVENELFELVTATLDLLPEETSVEAVASTASAELRRRLLAYAVNASAQVHALLLAHLLDYESQDRDGLLRAFEARAWISTGERRRAYTKLLEAGYVPPGATPGFLLGMLSEPDKQIGVYVAQILPYLPDEIMRSALEILKTDAGFTAIGRLLYETRIPLPSSLRDAILALASAQTDAYLRAYLQVGVMVGSDPIDSLLAVDTLQAVCKLPRNDWRVPGLLIRLAAMVPTDREQIQIEAWQRASEVGLEGYGAAQFSRMTSSITPNVTDLILRLLSRENADTAVRCLPYLLANSPTIQTKRVASALIDAMRCHSSYPDLAPCIDAVPSEMIPQMLDAATTLTSPALQTSRRSNRY